VTSLHNATFQKFLFSCFIFLSMPSHNDTLQKSLFIVYFYLADATFRNWKSRCPVGMLAQKIELGGVLCQVPLKTKTINWCLGAGGDGQLEAGGYWHSEACASGSQHLLQVVCKKNEETKQQSTCLVWASDGVTMLHKLIVPPPTCFHIFPPRLIVVIVLSCHCCPCLIVVLFFLPACVVFLMFSGKCCSNGAMCSWCLGCKAATYSCCRTGRKQ